MTNLYFVTFGQKYRREKHPVLGDLPILPDGYFFIKAEDINEANEIAVQCFGIHYSSVYDISSSRHLYPAGLLGLLVKDADENRKTLGVPMLGFEKGEE